MSSFLFFSRVPDRSFLSSWEYYKVDLDVLRNYKSSKIYIATTFFQAFTILLQSLTSSNKKIDLAYCWWWHSSAPIIILCKLLGIPVVTTGAIHMFDISGGPDYYNSGFLFRFFARLGLKYSSANHFISKDQFLSISSRLTIPNSRIIYPCTSTSSFSDFPFIPNNKLVLTSIAWMTPVSFHRKGVSLVLDALMLLSPHYRSLITYNIAGKTTDTISDLYNHFCPDELSDTVNFLPNITHHQKYDLYAASHFCSIVSWHEGFGNATLESMSVGTPCIVSRYTAQPELVNLSQGYVLLNNDSSLLADLLVDIIDNLSPNSYQTMRKNAFNRALEFSFSRREYHLHNLITESLPN